MCAYREDMEEYARGIAEFKTTVSYYVSLRCESNIEVYTYILFFRCFCLYAALNQTKKFSTH